MQAPRYIEPKSELKRYQKLSMDFHHRRLQEIKTGAFTKRIDNELPEYLKKPIRKTTKGHSVASAFDEVQRENDSLLERINEIGKGKRQGNFRTFSERRGPRSLRDQWRRQELRRIAEENDALARRILGKPSTLSAKKQIQEFELLRKYKLQISKAHLIDGAAKVKHDGRTGHLPPMQDSLQLNLSTQSDSHPKFKKKLSDKAKSFSRDRSLDSVVKKSSDVFPDPPETSKESKHDEMGDELESYRSQDQGIKKVKAEEAETKPVPKNAEETKQPKDTSMPAVEEPKQIENPDRSPSVKSVIEPEKDKTPLQPDSIENKQEIPAQEEVKSAPADSAEQPTKDQMPSVEASAEPKPKDRQTPANETGTEKDVKKEISPEEVPQQDAAQPTIEPKAQGDDQKPSPEALEKVGEEHLSAEEVN
mmetsp:Transcript_34062/g.59389  ORF Transcript_34062/g.59389 Transcript_34062/m.59389 type:complete len:420 (+) Transcript_34062:2959-4218(+)